MCDIYYIHMGRDAVALLVDLYVYDDVTYVYDDVTYVGRDAVALLVDLGCDPLQVCLFS